MLIVTAAVLWELTEYHVWGETSYPFDMRPTDINPNVSVGGTATTTFAIGVFCLVRRSRTAFWVTVLGVPVVAAAVIAVGIGRWLSYMS